MLRNVQKLQNLKIMMKLCWMIHWRNNDRLKTNKYIHAIFKKSRNKGAKNKNTKMKE
jgi:hypothetical protein